MSRAHLNSWQLAGKYRVPSTILSHIKSKVIRSDEKNVTTISVYKYDGNENIKTQVNTYLRVTPET